MIIPGAGSLAAFLQQERRIGRRRPVPASASFQIASSRMRPWN
jgi:hypothetical protein